MEQCHLSKDSIPLLYKRIVCYIHFLLHTLRIIAMFFKLIFVKNEIDHIILLFRNLNMYKICPNVCNSHCASGPGCTEVSLASPEASSLALFFFSLCSSVCCFSLCTSAPSLLLSGLWTTPGSYLLFQRLFIVCAPAQAVVPSWNLLRFFLIYLNVILIQYQWTLLLLSQFSNSGHVTSILLLPFMKFKSY